MKTSLKTFDSDRVAAFELRMWKAYYGHHFLTLVFVLVRFLQMFFGFSMAQAVWPGYHAAVAAMLFRLRKGREREKDKELILKHLVAFYYIISKHSVESFDYQKVAVRELEWWFIDRYPERHVKTREEAIADTVSVMYGLPLERFGEYALYRAQAMVLQDSFKRGKDKEVDWEMVGLLLQKSYRSLHGVFA